MANHENGEPEYEGSDLEALATLRRYQQWIVDTFKPNLGGETIEFGAGLGNISKQIRPLVGSLDLVEPSHNLYASLENQFREDEGVRLYNEHLEERLLDISDNSYDSVVLVNVLEHIENDTEALRGFYRILKPGGHLLLFVPALRFLYSDLDAMVGHFRRYHRPELNSHVAEAGFDIVRSRYFDIIGVGSWWVLNTLLGSTTFNPRLVNLYDAVFAPLSRGIERMINPPFGKNIVLIAKRPE